MDLNLECVVIPSPPVSPIPIDQNRLYRGGLDEAHCRLKRDSFRLQFLIIKPWATESGTRKEKGSSFLLLSSTHTLSLSHRKPVDMSQGDHSINLVYLVLWCCNVKRVDDFKTFPPVLLFILINLPCINQPINQPYLGTSSRRMNCGCISRE